MLVKVSSAFVGIFVMLLWADNALSAAAPNPECPWVKPSNTWVEFIMRRVPYSGDKRPSYVFSVRFENMGSIKDSKRFTGENDPLGIIWAGSCYTVFYNKGRWSASGYNEKKGESDIIDSKKGAANPEDYLITIGDRIYEFNEAGELFDLEHGHVGNFRCVLDRNICKYYAK